MTNIDITTAHHYSLEINFSLIVMRTLRAFRTYQTEIKVRKYAIATTYFPSNVDNYTTPFLPLVFSYKCSSITKRSWCRSSHEVVRWQFVVSTLSIWSGTNRRNCQLTRLGKALLQSALLKRIQWMKLFSQVPFWQPIVFSTKYLNTGSIIEESLVWFEVWLWSKPLQSCWLVCVYAYVGVCVSFF